MSLVLHQKKKMHVSKLIYRLATKQAWTHTKTHTLKALEGWCMIEKEQTIPGLKKKNLAALNASAEESHGPESLIVHAGNKADLFNDSQYVSARVSYKSDGAKGISICPHTPVNIIITA